jgi:23S rRNA (cytidine1920-2'-O)/16S rRNA (cytidine1409-2'-O)-methyltransferase
VTSEPKRLDVALVERGLAPSRTQAREAILAGRVSVDGSAAARPSQPVGHEAAIAVAEGHGHVSRSALKLIAGLDRFGYDPAGRIALDLGASTGGFTEVLLARGATKVYAIDVGHGQLHPKVAADPRVIAHEGVNARHLGRDTVPEPVDAIVADLSFISLKLALPPALALASAEAFAVLLVKPQFEVGPAHVGKGGIVRDAKLARRTAEGVAAWLASEHGWRVDGLVESPILGGDGNREFLLGARHG